jgi:hypothetical protein
MCSRHWTLEVIALNTVIDGKELQQLAYLVEETTSCSDETILTLSPFSKEDNDLLEGVVLDFYFPENPSVGLDGAASFRFQVGAGWFFASGLQQHR